MKSGRTTRSRFQAAIAEALEPRQLLSGTEYLVNSLDDTVAADGVVTFREAVEAANLNAPVGDAAAGSSAERDRITFAPDLTGTIAISGDWLSIDGSLSIEGPGPDRLTLRGDGRGRVLRVNSSGDVQLSGLLITGGDGGVYNTGTLAMDNVKLSGNIASDEGGGVYNASGAVTMNNVTISGNTAHDGGGVFNSHGTLTVSNSTISRNTVSSGNTASSGGGGVGNVFGTVAMDNVTISGNTADWGGGVVNTYGTLTVSNSTISSNIALGFAGGLANSSGPVFMTNVVVSGNSASTAGGGFYQTSGAVTMSNATISGNTAGSMGGGLSIQLGQCAMDNVKISGNTSGKGGGLYCEGPTITMSNALVLGNSATWGSGGGIYAAGGTYGGGTLTVNNATIARNTATSFGGLYVSVSVGSTKLTNSIVAGNLGGTHPDVGMVLGAGSDYNLIGVNTTTGVGPHSLYGTLADPLDPRLDTLGRLLPGSPALNAGSNALAVDASGHALTTDIEGKPRIAGGSVDIGACEYQPQILVIGDTQSVWNDTITLASDEESFSYKVNSNPTIRMPRSLVTVLKLALNGKDEVSFDVDLQTTDLMIEVLDPILPSISQAIASNRIRSSSADDLHGLGAILNQDAQGKMLYTRFDDQPVNGAFIFVKLTLNGDADLNGLLDGSDYFLIDKGFLSRTSANPPTGYYNGDFNYDGQIDGSDYFLIDKAFLSQQSTPAAAAPLSAVASPSGVVKKLLHRRRVPRRFQPVSSTHRQTAR